MYNLIEMSIALAVAFAINVSVIGVSGAVCGRTDLVPGDRDNCNNLDLNRAPFLLKVQFSNHISENVLLFFL